MIRTPRAWVYVGGAPLFLFWGCFLSGLPSAPLPDAGQASPLDGSFEASGSDGATGSDAPPTDAAAGCLLFRDASFCDDFERDAGGWSVGRTGPGEIGVGAVQGAPSPPQGLRVTRLENAGGFTRLGLERTLESNLSGVHLEYTVRFAPGVASHVNVGAISWGTYAVQFAIRSQETYLEELVNDQNSTLGTPGPALVPGNWTRVGLHFEGRTIRLTLNGSTALGRAVLPNVAPTGAPTIRVGIDYATTPVNVEIDDVVIAWTK